MMPENNERVRLLLLRVLGVLLILVGFTIIARSAQRTDASQYAHGFQHVRTMMSDAMDGIDRCKRIRVDARAFRVPKPPAPPHPPTIRVLD